MHDGKEHRKKDLEMLRRLPVPRTRIIVAVVLVTTMLCMWGRLLLSGNDRAPAAVPTAAAAAAVTAGQMHPRLTPVDLPIVAGRHDRLSRDVFATANWKAFQATGGASPAPLFGPLTDLTQNDISIIEQNLRLDGIIAAQYVDAREAFINGKLVSVGSGIKIEYKARQLVLTVIAIQRNKVILGLENFTLNVAMPQTDSLNK